MVSDTAFYIVLGIAIVLFVLLVTFINFVKQKMPDPMMYKILTTLHAALFGYETAMVDLIGNRGYKTHVYPEIIKVINTLKDDNSRIMELFTTEDSLEAMQKWVEERKDDPAGVASDVVEDFAGGVAERAEVAAQVDDRPLEPGRLAGGRESPPGGECRLLVLQQFDFGHMRRTR